MRPDESDRSEVRAFGRRAFGFALVGLAIYGALYLASELLVGRYAERNRFHVIQTAEHDRYDFVLLGASHAAVFDYRDLNDRLEEMSGSTVLNLAALGAGVTLNRLLLEYFFEHRGADAIVYVLDSFAFYSSSFNEERLRDSELFLRAGWDASLATLLLQRRADLATLLTYVSGFSKINNPARFEPDSFPAEGSSFDRSYRPVPQIDRQRIEFLYPDGAEADVRDRYFEELESLIAYSRSQGSRFVVVRPPLPPRVRDMIPGEDEFDDALADRLEGLDVPVYDFSGVNNDEELFYDSDHLNREGALRFLAEHLTAVLTTER